eukprot:RCo049537
MQPFYLPTPASALPAAVPGSLTFPNYGGSSIVTAFGPTVLPTVSSQFPSTTAPVFAAGQATPPAGYSLSGQPLFGGPQGGPTLSPNSAQRQLTTPLVSLDVPDDVVEALDAGRIHLKRIGGDPSLVSMIHSSPVKAPSPSALQQPIVLGSSLGAIPRSTSPTGWSSPSGLPQFATTLPSSVVGSLPLSATSFPVVAQSFPSSALFAPPAAPPAAGLPVPDRRSA